MNKAEVKSDIEMCLQYVHWKQKEETTKILSAARRPQAQHHQSPTE